MNFQKSCVSSIHARSTVHWTLLPEFKSPGSHMSLTLVLGLFIQQVHSYIDTIELFPWVKRGFSFQYQTLHVVWYTFSNQPIHPQIVRRQSCFPFNNRRTAITNEFPFPAISSKKKHWLTFWSACINVWLDEGLSPNRGHEERPRAIYYVPRQRRSKCRVAGYPNNF